MIRHHPTHDMLLEHTAGTLSWALSLSITAHLQMCTQCRQQVHQLNDIGGALLESGATEAPAATAFQRLMSKIEQVADEDTLFQEPPLTLEITRKSFRKPTSNKPAVDISLADLPKVVRKLLPTDRPLVWERMLSSLRVARLTNNMEPEEVCLYHIASGGRISEHNHRGQEVTLVLSGSFSDTRGLYSAGDFLVQEPGEVHKPTATQNQPCLCLMVTQAPVAPTGLFGWLVNRFTTAERI